MLLSYAHFYLDIYLFIFGNTSEIWNVFVNQKRFPYVTPPLRVRVDLVVIEMKWYSTLSRSPELELHCQIQFCVIARTQQNVKFND